MALCPFAERKLLPESATQPHIVARAVILHSAAGRGSLYNFFRTSSNLESHFWVSETGRIEQYIDTARRADANNRANGFAISIETESSPAATEPWNAAQFMAIVRLVRWCCTEHRIPARNIPAWDSSGIGWHIQFGAPGPWTPVAKSCPGPARIRQMPSLVAAVAAAPGTGTPPPTTPQELTVADVAAIMKKLDQLAAQQAATDLRVQRLEQDLIDGDRPDLGTVPERTLASLSRLERKGA